MLRPSRSGPDRYGVLRDLNEHQFRRRLLRENLMNAWTKVRRIDDKSDDLEQLAAQLQASLVAYFVARFRIETVPDVHFDDYTPGLPAPDVDTLRDKVVTLFAEAVGDYAAEHCKTIAGDTNRPYEDLETTVVPDGVVIQVDPSSRSGSRRWNRDEGGPGGFATPHWWRWGADAPSGGQLVLPQLRRPPGAVCPETGGPRRGVVDRAEASSHRFPARLPQRRPAGVRRIQQPAAGCGKPDERNQQRPPDQPAQQIPVAGDLAASFFRYLNCDGLGLKLPPLVYGRTYDAAVFIVGNAGVLPPELAARKDGKAMPWKMKDLAQIDDTAIGPYIRPNFEYKRRNAVVYRVGKDSDDQRQSAFENIDLPAIPATVVPIIRSLTEEGDPAPNIPEARRPLLLLRPPGDPRRPLDRWSSAAKPYFRFLLRPPSVDLQVWDRWVGGDGLDLQRRKQVWGGFYQGADLHGTTVSPTNQRDLSIDDPAVADSSLPSDAFTAWPVAGKPVARPRAGCGERKRWPSAGAEAGPPRASRERRRGGRGGVAGRREGRRREGPGRRGLAFGCRCRSLPATRSNPWDDLLMQGIDRVTGDLWDAGEVTGHLVAPGSVFAFLAEHRRELFPDSFTADLFPSRTGCPSLPAGTRRVGAGAQGTV